MRVDYHMMHTAVSKTYWRCGEGAGNQKFQDVDSVMERLDCSSKKDNSMYIYCIRACLPVLCSSELDSSI